MSTVKKLSLAGTIITIISFLAYLGFFIFSLILLNSDELFELARKSYDTIENIDKNSPSAGYEFLFGMSGVGLGLFAGVAVFVLLFMLGFICFYLLPSIISGLVALGLLKKYYPSEPNRCYRAFKVDGYIKSIMMGLLNLFGVSCLIGSLLDGDFSAFAGLIILFGSFIAVFVISIIQLIKIKKYR